MDRITQVAALGFIVILTTAGFVYWNMDTSDTNADDPTDETPEEIREISINSSLQLSKTSYFEGENIDLNFEIETPNNVTLNSLLLNITDPHYNRRAAKSVDIDILVPKGTSSFNLSVEPAFPIGDGVVLSEFNASYQIFAYKVFYNTSVSQVHNKIGISLEMEINENLEVNQADNLEWNITDNGASIVQSASNFTLSAATNTTVILQTSIIASKFPKIDIEGSGIGTGIQYFIGGDELSLVSNYLSIGNYLGDQNFTIIANITGGIDKQLNISIITKPVVLFAAIANSYWEAPSGEIYNYRTPAYYIRQASFQFEQVLNVKIIPAKTFTVSKPPSSGFSFWLQRVINETASALDLPADVWELGSGTFTENEGFDVLLVFTNATMSNLGVVFGDLNEGAFNTAMHARGSQNSGNWRLPTQYADNLIQHEVSHVFGAPDRYTASSPPSIMSKSLADDFIQDIIAGDFWLDQVSWLEVDIQTMFEETRTLYW